jgi:hypothetical protein
MSEIKINNIPVITENNGSVSLTTDTANISVGSGDIVSNLDGSPMITYRNGTNSWFHAGKHPSDDAFIFTTGATSTTTERMRIDSDGYVHTPKNDFILNSRFSLTGGGDLSHTGSATDSRIKWTERIIAIANGDKSTISPDGYFDINMPPVGTTIHGIGNNTDVVVDSSGIPLKNWSSLWYALPIGSSHDTANDNFYWGYYGDFTLDTIPKNWIPIVYTNGDTLSYHPAKFMTGVNVPRGTTTYPDTNWITPSLINGWVDYGGGFSPPQYRRINNTVHIQGLVKDGTIYGSIFTLPDGFRPPRRLIFNTMANSASARYDIYADGSCVHQSGSTAWFSICCTFAL